MAPPAKYRWGQWNLVAGLQHFLQPRTERCFGGTQRLVREGLKQAQVSLVMLLIEPHVLLEQVGHRDERYKRKHDSQWAHRRCAVDVRALPAGAGGGGRRQLCRRDERPVMVPDTEMLAQARRRFVRNERVEEDLLENLLPGKL